METIRIELDKHVFSGDGDGVEADGIVPGGESVRVSRFLGLVRVGKRSLVRELGGVCHPELPPWHPTPTPPRANCDIPLD